MTNSTISMGVAIMFVGSVLLGDCLDNGAKALKNGGVSAAIKAYEAADRNDGKCELAAFALQSKYGDYEAAYIDILKSVEKGNAEACYYKGLLEYNGKGTEKDLTKAFESFLEASRLGFSPALYYVAVMYFKGEGVEQNHALAYDYIVQASNAGVNVRDAEIRYFKEKAGK